MVQRCMVDLANPCFQCRVMDLLLHCNSTMGFRWTINRNNSNRPGIKLQELEEGENKLTESIIVCIIISITVVVCVSVICFTLYMLER